MNEIGKEILKRDLLAFKTKEELVEMDMNMLDKIDNLQSKIDKANEILDKLCVMKPWNDTQDKMRKIYRPIKNTSKQEVYKAICDLRDILKEDK